MILDFPLNRANLPYPDPLHAIVVHFVIAMVIISFLFEVVGLISKRQSLLNAGWWNLVVAAIAIFFAILFGQFEIGLTQPSQAAQPVIDRHLAVGWLLLLLLPNLALWQGIERSRDRTRISKGVLMFKAIVVVLVCYQFLLGTTMYWVYGLHVEPVSTAGRAGLLTTAANPELTGEVR